MLQIRPVEEKDFEILAEIYTNSYNTLDIGEKWDNKSALELMKHLYKEQSDLFFVAEDEGEVVGAIVAIVKPWWDGNHITDGEVFVNPDYQGKGIGTSLIEKLFTEAQLKYQAISWDTFTHRVHQHPLKWYKELGFEEIENWVMITGNIKKVLENVKKKKMSFLDLSVPIEE